jgi:hypothetical protein
LYLTTISFALVLAAVIFLLVGPAYPVAGGGGLRHATGLEIYGWRAIIPVMFPVLIGVAPLAFRMLVVRIIAAVVMFMFIFITAFTIGTYFLPAAILMLLAAFIEDSTSFRDFFG